MLSAEVVVAKAGLLTAVAVNAAVPAIAAVGERCLGADRDLPVVAAAEEEADPIHRLFNISKRRDFTAVTAGVDSDVALDLLSLLFVGAVVLTLLVVEATCRARTSLCRK
jgi:hypothetical protein